MIKISIVAIGTDVILKNKYGVFSRNGLEDRLKKGHLTAKKLGNSYNLKDYQMVHVLRLLKISYRNSINDTRILSAIISPSQHQIILGTLLGDAFMGHPKRYDLCHGINQKDYCYYVAEKLHQFVSSIKIIDTNQGTKAVVFWTHRHDVFLSYFDKFYSKGKNKKFITQEALKDLTAEGLSYWYMDDGKLTKYGAYLCTGKITQEEGQTIVSFLRDKFQIRVTVQSWNKEKGYLYIYINSVSRNLFFSLISPYVIPSMRYKLPLVNTRPKIRTISFC